MTKTRGLDSDALERLEFVALEGGVYDSKEEMREDGYSKILTVLLENLIGSGNDSELMADSREFERGYNA